tara:strand:- start:260 stop:2467 length:2208 start_codon:yes stop_codon:yes gene_type:complete
MTKNILKSLTIFLIIIFIFLFYLSTYGINTEKFNSVIENKFKTYNDQFNIKLNKVKLVLNLKNFSLSLKTLNTKLIYKKQEFKINEIRSNLSIKAYFENDFILRDLYILADKNNIKDLLKTYKAINFSPQILIIESLVEKGLLKSETYLSFDSKGNVNEDFKINGKITDAKIGLLNNKKLESINLDFSVKKNDLNFKNITLNFNNLNLQSEKIKIIPKDNFYMVNGTLKSKNNKINNHLKYIFTNKELKNFNFKDTNFKSDNKFSFNLNKKFKIDKLKINSKIILDKFIYNSSIKLNTFLPEHSKILYFTENDLNIDFIDDNLKIIGNSSYLIKDKKNKIKYNIEKIKNNLKFKLKIDLNNLILKFSKLDYVKEEINNASIDLQGSLKINKDIIIDKLNYIENKNYVKIKNLKLNNKYRIKSLKDLKINLDTKNNKINKISVIKKNKNYLLISESLDGIELIKNLTDTKSKGNFFNIFDELNTLIKLNIDKVYLSKKEFLKNLNGDMKIQKNQIIDSSLFAKYSEKEKFLFTIKTSSNGEKITTVYSDKAKPFVENYKFIKGFEDGVLDFKSIKKENTSKSILKIDNFKVKEMPLLAKILTLASLQGIADILTGEGIRFTDFEMIFKKKGNLITIEEIYAIGPAISIMMNGYIETDKLISLRGTLVPATTINRSIASIPLLGDILIGKKVGEGVFGVSFKIKGTPGNLKSTVNPIKTLTPRFITRTLEKIKKTNQ